MSAIVFSNMFQRIRFGYTWSSYNAEAIKMLDEFIYDFLCENNLSNYYLETKIKDSVEQDDITYYALELLYDNHDCCCTEDYTKAAVEFELVRTRIEQEFTEKTGIEID